MSSVFIMICINITNYLLISQLQKDHGMIETCCLKNVVIFFPNNFWFFSVKKNNTVSILFLCLPLTSY